MSIDKVRSYFSQYGMEGRILEFPTSSATVEQAAKTLGVSPMRIAKTLSFSTDDGTVLLLAAGDARVDNQKYRNYFGCKARMLPSDQVERIVGHGVGGVCPFGISPDIEVFTDISLQRFSTVFPACGSSNSAIELTCDELFRHAQSSAWIDVCKDYADVHDPVLNTDHFALSDLSGKELLLRLLDVSSADEKTGYVPAYKFSICLPTGEQIGVCDLRIGYVRGTHFGGNIGYAIDAPYRGHHYAEKACRLLFALAFYHSMPYVIISCEENNVASYRTCERLGGRLLEIAELPPDTELYRDGMRRCRLYRFDLLSK